MTWAMDMQEYFVVSGFSTYFEALAEFRMPTIAGDATQEQKTAHLVVLSQARYSICPSKGKLLKKDMKLLACFSCGQQSGIVSTCEMRAQYNKSGTKSQIGTWTKPGVGGYLWKVLNGTTRGLMS